MSTSVRRSRMGAGEGAPSRGRGGAAALPRIGPRSAGMAMTPEEFDAIPEDRWVRGNRYELIQGVLVVSPPVSNQEVDPNDELGYLLRLYQETHPEGRVIDVTMPERGVPGTPNRRRCDRAIWLGLGRVPDTKVDVPAVVVEFVSGGRRDMVRDYERKRDEYLDAGVVEYWIIDRFRRMMTVYRAGVCGPTVEHVLEASTYRTALMPGFELPLARLLARADAWKKPKAKRGSRPPTDADPAVIPPPATDPDPDPAPPAPTNPPTGGER